MPSQSRMEAPKIKECHYCGSKATIVHDKNSGGYYGACENEKCNVHTELFHSALQARDEWNGGAVSDTWYKK